jgi:hypothetical protein
MQVASSCHCVISANITSYWILSISIGTTSYCTIWNISEKYNYVFITKMHTTDGQDNKHVTRKLHVVGPLIDTSDVCIMFCPSLLYIYQ